MTDICVHGEEIWVQQNRHSFEPWAPQSCTVCEVANTLINSSWDPVLYFHPPDKVVSWKSIRNTVNIGFLLNSVSSTRLCTICRVTNRAFPPVCLQCIE